jgi:hypothetical protein
MHFHVPKPLHGWRELAGEVGIIVIGVLIALSAEQVVEALHWQSEVGQLRDAMRVELSADRARTEENLAQDPCMLVRLDAIEQWAATAPEGSRIANPERPLLWNNHSSTWDIAKTSPAATHLALGDRLQYAGAYDSIANEQRYLFGEQESWQELAASLASADKPQNRDLIERQVESARLHLAAREANARSLLRRLDVLKIRPASTDVDITVNLRRLCQPLPSSR